MRVAWHAGKAEIVDYFAFLGYLSPPMFFAGSGYPPPRAVLARDQEGRTDKFGVRASTAADAIAGRSIPGTWWMFRVCWFWLRCNRCR